MIKVFDGLQQSLKKWRIAVGKLSGKLEGTAAVKKLLKVQKKEKFVESFKSDEDLKDFFTKAQKRATSNKAF